MRRLRPTRPGILLILVVTPAILVGLRRWISTTWAGLVALVLGTMLIGCSGEPVDSVAESERTAAESLLEEVGAEFHRLELEGNLWLQLKYGVETATLPDLSHAHAEMRSRSAGDLLERLSAIRGEDLGEGERVSLDSLRWDLRVIASSGRFYWLTFPITPYAFNVLGVHNLFQTMEIDSPEASRRYLDLAGGYPGFLTALRDKLASQRERGIVLPLPEIEMLLPSWRSFVDSPQTVFPYLDEVPASAAEGFQLELGRLIETEIRPAWGELVSFLEGDYLGSAPRTVGLSQYPDGDAYYDWLIRQSVTLEISAEEIHRIGLERLAATNERMRRIREELGFSGTAAEFHRRLAADPRFFADTPEEVERRLLRHIEDLEPRVESFFLRIPRAPYRLVRLSPELEPDMTYGYYIEPSVAEPHGTYFYNGSRLDDRSLIGAASLIYHELVPGHHFQVCLQTENEALPVYRRDAWHDAFGEGWAEYASELAEEMGMYRAPYDLYGRLADENLFSARLVVDTGMNRLGWSRQRAGAFMREHTLMSETEIDTEMLRYSVDIPAQALAYAMGSLKIRQLRERARERLGERFDIRRVHAAVLDHGSMPLAVLEQHVDRFIEAELRE